MSEWIVPSHVTHWKTPQAMRRAAEQQRLLHPRQYVPMTELPKASEVSARRRAARRRKLRPAED